MGEASSTRGREPSRIAVAAAKALLRLFPASAPQSPVAGRRDLPKHERARIRGRARAWSEYEDERDHSFVEYFEGLDLTGEVVFDFGSGYGGRLAHLGRGARRLALGLEVNHVMGAAGLEIARETGLERAAFVAGVGEALPFRDESVDVILSYDVLEHVADPRACLAECFRVLKPGGGAFIVFPPYYHPTGSHLEGYVSRLPYANAIFPGRVLVRAVDEILAERGDRFRPGALRPGDKLYWLNGLTIGEFEAMVDASGFETVSMRLLPLVSRVNRLYGRFGLRYLAWALAPLPKVPVVREYFTHRVAAALRKPAR